jgi:hypothetical protein
MLLLLPFLCVSVSVTEEDVVDNLVDENDKDR